MSDIVERLRDASYANAPSRCMEAANEIERLRSEKLELAKHIDGCVRVAADALKRAEVAEAQLLAVVGKSHDAA